MRPFLDTNVLVYAQSTSAPRAALGPVRSLDFEVHSKAVALAWAHGFNIYDAVIIASAQDAGCDQLLTEDLQAGRRIEGLRIVNPFA